MLFRKLLSSFSGILNLRGRVPENGGLIAPWGLTEVLRKCLVQMMVHLVEDEVLAVLHRPDPGERVIHGVLRVECSVGYFEVGVGVGCEELDEGRVGVPGPEIHQVDVNLWELV